MAYVEIHNEAPKHHEKDKWVLTFLKMTYHYDDGSSDGGFRFIWRRPDGTLQAAGGLTRLKIFNY